MISMHITHMSLPQCIEELRSEVEEWQDILMRCFGDRHALMPYATKMKSTSMHMRRRVKMRKKFNEHEAADAYAYI